jgi:hypothetical protein
MSKKLLRFVSLGAVLLLTGCITIDIQNIINADGSGEKIMITAFDTDTYEMMMATPEAEEGEEGEEEPVQAEDPFEELMAACEEDPRATCEEYEDPERGLTGVRVSVPFDSLDDLIALSDSPTVGGADEISFEQTGDATTMHIVVNTETVGGEVVEGTEGEEMEATPEPEATLTPEEEEQMRQMLEMMDINFFYRVTAPAPITDYEPTENATYDEAENTLTWKLDLLSEEPSQELMVTWGGPPIEPIEEPTEEPAPTPTTEPAPEPTEEPATEAPSEPPAPSPEPPPEGPSTVCPSCMPAVALPVLALGGVLIVQRRRSV